MVHYFHYSWYISHVLTLHKDNFLPGLVLCMHGACDPSLDVSALISPLSLVCDSFGTPISQSALANAEGVASSVVAQSTVTVTHIDIATESNVRIRVGPQNSGPAGTEGGVTIIQTAPTQSGNIQVIISSYSASGSVSIIIDGSVYTSTTGSGGAGGASSILKTIATTNSAGSTYTTTQSSMQSSDATSSGSSPSGGASGTASSSTSTSTSISSTSSSSVSQTSSSATPSQVTNSARQEHAGSMLGVTVLFVFVGLWL